MPHALRQHAAGLALALAAACACAQVADEPALEARVLRLAGELRCLVCRNQTVAESHAALAEDLKRQIREQLRAGRSEREVLEYMVARFGDFVRYRPPLNGGTVLLWFGPFALLAAGSAVGWRVLRRHRDGSATGAAIEPDRRARAAALLDEV